MFPEPIALTWSDCLAGSTWIVEVIKVIPQEQMSKRIVEQIVGVPMPQILEQIVDVPVPQIQEQIVAVVKALFERRAVVQQLLTCVFFFKGGREMERGQGCGSLVRARAAALGTCPAPSPLSLRTVCRYRHRHERVQARLLFGRDWITQGALLDMIDAELDSWSWIVLHSTSSTVCISMEEQDRTRGPIFLVLFHPTLRILCFSPVPWLAL